MKPYPFPYDPPACYSCGSDAESVEWARGDIPMAEAVCCEVIAPADWPKAFAPEDLAWADGGGALPDDVDQFGA